MCYNDCESWVNTGHNQGYCIDPLLCDADDEGGLSEDTELNLPFNDPT